MSEGFCIVALALAGVALIVGLAYGSVSWSCHGYERATGNPTKMVAGSCYVQRHGSWHLVENSISVEN